MEGVLFHAFDRVDHKSTHTILKANKTHFMPLHS